MARRKRMHGRKRRSPAKFSSQLINKLGALRRFTPALNAKPVGEEQVEYDPEEQSKLQELELDRSRLEASMAMERQKEKYEGLFSGNKGNGSHTHGNKESMNTTRNVSSQYDEQTAIRTTGEIQQSGGFADFFKNASTTLANPFTKKTGFKMKRKK